MRVVIVSKALLVAAYRGKLAALAREADLELIALVPPSWRDRRGLTRLEPGATPGYRLIVTPILLNGHYHLYFYPRLGRLLRDLRPDIVHVDEEPYNLAAWQATLLADRVGARTCFFTWQNLLRRYPPPFRWFERACYQWAGHAIAGNQDAARVLRAKGYQGPITIIPQFGVDPELFSPREPPPETPFTVGYAGGLIPEKGVDLLIEAMARLPGEWRLLLAGEGKEQALLQRMAQDQGMADRVQFLRRLSSTQMPDFYRRLHVLVLPSRERPNWKEQFGRVLVEAMACGVPVVGSDCGEIPHVIRDAGLIFPQDDVDALRAHLSRLQRDADLRRDLARRGRERVLERFTHERVAAMTLAVYRSLCP
ncbi:MAG TPA: glycosyltransferase family 4 protein [Caldilineae bacterium]|jgi:glycosyltransferase involved in cell wall biosynthesis|nr:glycosyltransferase family 4 protein [Caldilineae bacterium]